MVTAYALTDQPGWEDKYDLTVYCLGWRLGGKGASGRNMDQGARIEEHGLHIWFGFYEHAFRMLRGAYEEAGLATGADWWKLPFEKCHSVSLYELRDDNTWARQSLELPARGGVDRGPPTEPRHTPLGLKSRGAVPPEKLA